MISSQRRYLVKVFTGTALCLVLIAVAPQPVAATSTLARRYTVTLWQTAEGLPQNSVQAIAQDRDGYLWVGTYGGVARFDGMTMTRFDSSNTPELREEVVNDLFVDRAGDLWIATGGGGLVRRSGDRFVLYTRAHGLPSDNVWDVTEDVEGRLVVGTQEGAAVIDAKRTSIRAIDPLRRQVVFAVYADTDGRTWFGTEASGLLEVDGQSARSYGVRDGLPTATIRTITRGKEALWIGTDAGVVRMQEGRFYTIGSAAGLSNSVVRAVTIDREGALWVGTYGGLNRVSGDTIESMTSADGLTTDAVKAVFEDRDGNIWVGTGGGGLMRLERSRIESLTKADGLANDTVRAVRQMRDGSVWIATFGGGITRIQDGAMRQISEADGLSHDVVFSFAEDADSVWIGTRHGLSRFTRGEVERVDLGRFSDATIRALHVSRDGTLWIGTVTHGVLRYRDGRVEQFRADSVLGRHAVFFIAESRDGSLWFATHGGGLAHLQGDALRLFTTRDGMSSDRVWSIAEDPDGTIWLGTRGGGLIRYRGGRFHSFLRRHGMFDNVIYHVISDTTGRLWLSGNRGIASVEKKQLDDFAAGRVPEITPMTFGRSDGMKTTECNGGSQPAGWQTSDGRIWFPTLKGVAIVDPARVERTSMQPRIFIESVLIDGHSARAGNELVVPPGAQRLEVRYTALSLSSTNNLKFRYRLVPYDAQWIDAGAQRIAVYTSLAPGRYSFLVTAARRDGTWSSRPATIRMEIRPRFRQTSWFYLLVLFVIGGIAALLYAIRVRRLKVRQKELTDLVSERTRELEAANQQLRDLSMRDGLTGLANRRDFDETLEREFRRASREGAPIALLLVDVDFFKPYNDRYGHQQGDECLRRVAQVLAATAKRAGDLAARYGGEEFAVILHRTDLGHAARIAGNILIAVRAETIPHEASGAADHVTVSIGAASVVPDHRLVPSDLIGLADAALYQAKRTGRDRVVVNADSIAAEAARS